MKRRPPMSTRTNTLFPDATPARSKRLEDRKGVKVVALNQRLSRKRSVLPDMQVFLQSIQNIRGGGRLSKSQYQYTIQGDDFHQLQDIVPKLEARLRTLPQMQDVSSDLQIRSPQALIDIDREKATTLGVSADAVRNTLYSAFGDRPEIGRAHAGTPVTNAQL